MTDSEQLTTTDNSLPDLATYYTQSAQSAGMMLEDAVNNAGGDYIVLAQNLKGVNLYIKARKDIGELVSQAQSISSPVDSWDPFSSGDDLETNLQVVQAKAEFTAIATNESAAVALYQAGLTYREISDNTGLPQKMLKKLVKKQGVQRERKKSVPMIP
jgi:hypothetical protein